MKNSEMFQKVQKFQAYLNFRVDFAEPCPAFANANKLISYSKVWEISLVVICEFSFSDADLLY